MAKFKCVTDTPVTLFIGGDALRLHPGEEYETDEPSVVKALKASAEVEGVKTPKPEAKKREDKDKD